MVEPYRPDFRPDIAAPELQVRTDLASLMSEPASSFLDEEDTPSGRAPLRTDFQSLKSKQTVAPIPRRTITDSLLDTLTPCLIFIMTYSVIFFLLDVRYVYTAVHDANLRFVAFFFVVGVVALNRLIARDGSNESMVYMFGLAGAIGLYTFSTTGAYDVGAITRNFMNSNPYLATGFNMLLVAFIWWVVNRLTHECCVDENRSAGDVGILTGTARRIESSLRRDPSVKAREKRQKAIPAHLEPFIVLEAFDPTEPLKTKPRAVEKAPDATDRLSGRHPGISIFYFSIPVMLIFSIGLRVVQHGGSRMVQAGEFYMGVYTVSALMLLMLTSLGGLREYFRMRRIAMPDRIGVFWVSLGALMIAAVLLGALQLPRPMLPSIAYVDEHQADVWKRGDTFQLAEVSATPAEIFQQSRFVQFLGNAFLVLLVLIALYIALKGLAAFAFRIARNRARYPRFVVRFFDAIEHTVSRLTQLPRLPTLPKRRRIQRTIATCTGYTNSMGDPDLSAAMNTGDHVGYAYEALCALAYDLGVPRAAAQTPYEFIEAFPSELDALREEADELTRLYVLAAYSPIEMTDQVRDRLRKFWTTYNRVRNRVLV